MTDDEAREVVLYANNIPYVTSKDVIAMQRQSIELLQSSMYSTQAIENAIKGFACAGIESPEQAEISEVVPKTDYLKIRMTIEKIPFWELVRLCGFWKAIELYFERRKT